MYRLRPSIGERLSAWVGAALLISPPVAYCLLWDVHFVVVKCPLRTVGGDTYASMAASRAASALGVARALEEITDDGRRPSR